MLSALPRLLLLFSGLYGGAGVAFAAVAAHGGGDVALMAAASQIAMVHAAALVGLGAVPQRSLRFAPFAGALIALGVFLFSGDLALRFFTGARLFEGAAPTGGSLLVAGWLVVAAGAIAAAFSGGNGR